MIKLAIIDDHPIVLAGLRHLLEDYAAISIVGTFSNSNQLLDFIAHQQVAVLLLDLQLPATDPVQFIKALKRARPSMRILVLTNMDQIFTARTMLAAGADGYVLKGIDKYTLIEAIESVSQGVQYIDACLRDDLRNTMLGTGDGLPLLTDREQRILEMIAKEMTTKQIAAEIHLSSKRVESLRSDLFQKLQVKNTAGLVRKGINLGLLPGL